MNTRTIRPSLFYAALLNIPYLIGVAITLVLLGAFEELRFIDPYTMPLSIVFYVYKVMLTRSNRFEINKEQLVHKKGVFSKHIDFLELYRVKDYQISKPWYLRIIQCMKVTIKSSDKNKPVLHLFGVPDSDIVYNLRNLVELQRKNKRVYEID